jgi:hypothetical protein
MSEAGLPYQRNVAAHSDELARPFDTRTHSSWREDSEARKQDHGSSAYRMPFFVPLLTLLQLPIRELHYDTDIWGSNPERLDPDRFVKNTKLSKILSYRPWGGGHTLCPGRFFARRSANAFVAILLTKYNVAVESSAFPKGDGARPSPGVVTVGRGQDVKLRLTPRG